MFVFVAVASTPYRRTVEITLQVGGDLALENEQKGVDVAMEPVFQQEQERFLDWWVTSVNRRTRRMVAGYRLTSAGKTTDGERRR